LTLDSRKPALQAEDEGKDQEKADGPYAALGADNQKLNLVAAMLQVDDWASAEVLLEALEPVLPVAYAPVAQAFCQHIHRFIDTVYRQVQVGCAECRRARVASLIHGAALRDEGGEALRVYHDSPF
jgi:hypothetical protein